MTQNLESLKKSLIILEVSLLLNTTQKILNNFLCHELLIQKWKYQLNQADCFKNDVPLVALVIDR